jgi:hypothetical protein
MNKLFTITRIKSMDFHDLSTEHPTHVAIQNSKRIIKTARKKLERTSSQNSLSQTALRSVFNQYEINQYPATLFKAISKVEKHLFIKERLHQAHRKISMDDVEIMKLRNPQKGSTRLGIDQLPIFSMADITGHDVPFNANQVQSRKEVSNLGAARQ